MKFPGSQWRNWWDWHSSSLLNFKTTMPWRWATQKWCLLKLSTDLSFNKAKPVEKQPALGWHTTKKLKNVYFFWPCHHCQNTIGNTTTDQWEIIEKECFKRFFILNRNIFFWLIAFFLAKSCSEWSLTLLFSFIVILIFFKTAK